MKKFLLFVGVFFIPFIVFASTYTTNDLSINYDDSKWIVFTRDNIKGNAKLKELGIDEDNLRDLYEKGYIYIDALLNSTGSLSTNLESFVLIKDVENTKNLHTYSSSDLKDLENEVVKAYNSYTISDHGLYTSGNYKYVYVVYKDQGLNIYDYYTVINGKGYTVKFQKPSSFATEETSLMKTTVNSVTFKLDEKYEKNSSFNWNRVITYAIAGGIIGGLSALASSLSNKKKKQAQQSSEFTQTTESNVGPNPPDNQNPQI